uniref:heavy metal translocating P-type ATPase n=1 Tax=Pseudomonas laurentiana TaxID=2364649 RepID=UPI0029C9A726|nr:heavy metal translocating P-type ATPase [Pseudomonas laurentiana]
MPFISQLPYRALLVVSALTLLVGTLLHLNSQTALAHGLWLAGVIPVLLGLCVDIVKTLLRRQAGVDVLALLSIGLALVLDEILTAAVIALMVASGRALEDYAEAQARREMTALLNRAPRVANRYEDGQLRQISLEQVLPGDRLLVRSGEVVPVDGTLSSLAELDESMLTGESLPARRLSGDTVRSGAINAGAAFDMTASASAANSTFAGIVRLVSSAQATRSPVARLADRYALLFVPLALALAGLAWFATADPIRLLAVLVVATPCPLILAVPVAIVSGMSRCARRGVLVKGGGALERLAQANTLFFDKTGTLTGGNARLVAIQCEPHTRADEVLRLAASLDQASNHVIAAAIVAAARERGLVLSVPAQVVEEPGAGVSGQVDGKSVTVGAFAYVIRTSAPASWSQLFLQRLRYDGACGVFVGVDGVMQGALHLTDEIRLETPRALRLLRRAGIERFVMLTGDRQHIADSIGAVLGVTDVRAEQTPADKLAAIQAARRDGVVIMVGDGVNDAPALAAADIGVSMGARGADASSEAADVVLLVDRLDRLAEALMVARRTRRIAVQSVAVGMGLTLVAMVVAAFGYLPPVAGALLQEVIDLVAILSALRARQAGSMRPSGGLSSEQWTQLQVEHQQLKPVLDSVRSLADRLSSLSGPVAAAELAELNERLLHQLLPHERQDDSELYPRIAVLTGGDDPMAAMNSTHREIFRITGRLAHIAQELPESGPDPAYMQEIQRLLYGLDAILRLHFAQEEELYHAFRESS